MKARIWLAVALGASLGIAVGIGEQYAGWVKSSHHAVASCNDCHTPPGTIPKYLTKASNGFWHSFYFTTGDFPEPIRIRPRNRAVTEAACRNCHQDMVEAMDVGHGSAHARDQVECLRCHGAVGHGGGLGRWDLATTASRGNDDE